MLYAKLKQREKAIKELQDLGVVPTTVLRNLKIFEEFHRHPDLCVTCRYEALADAFGLKDPSSIQKIIYHLSK